MAGQNPHPARFGLARDLGDQAGLSDAGLARYQDEATAAGQCLVDRPPQTRPLAVPLDERRQRRSLRGRPTDRRLGPHHLEEPPPLRESLEPEEARVDESPRSAGLYGIAERCGYQDLASGGLGHDPGRRVQGLSVELTGPLVDLADVDPDADPDPVFQVGRVVLIERALDADRAADGLERGPEGKQESVPEELPLLPGVAADLISQDLGVGAEDLVGD